MPTFSQKELIAYTPPKQHWIIEGGLLLPGARMGVMGPKKSWKSMLVSVDLAHKLSNGHSWLGFNTTKSNVMVVQEEIPLVPFRDRVTGYVAGHNLPGDSDNLIFNNDPIKLGRMASNSYNNLLQLIKLFCIDVLILDPLYKIVWGNLVDTEDMVGFTDCVDRLISDSGNSLAVIIIHHVGKAQYTSDGDVIDRGSEASLGSSIFNNWYDTGIMVNRITDETLTVRFPDLRLAPNMIKPKTLHYDEKTISFSETSNGTKLEGGLLE